tara:strand:+ start:1228 stop:2682 length:1455 start_codon:yes stop_codon:yes gene_type:complete
MQNLKNTYSKLPKEFHRSIKPTPVSKPRVLSMNYQLANNLSIDTSDNAQLLEYFSGNKVPDNSSTIAMAYAGHQFGNFVPQLGDGRAILIGELIDESGKLNDIQLKGSGPTAFSRQGDGRSAIGPVIREYILSEAMHAMNVPTTRALAAISTGDDVFRETALKGGILTRVSNSLIRVGTFEFFRARQDLENLRVLADFSIKRLYPEISDQKNKYLLLFDAVAEKQSILISKWMSIGFIHGVMNTDNFSISGETIDYGPCAFMEEYNPDTVFSSIDRHGRYKYSNQPKIALWNLSCLAGCLLPIIDGNEDKKEEIIRESLENFSENLNSRINIEMTKKIGLKETQESNELTKNLLSIMHQNGADFTLTFRSLSSSLKSNDDAFLQCFKSNEEPKDWLNKWKNLIKKENKNTNAAIENLNSINPIYIPRNHMIERAIREYEEENTHSIMDEMLKVTADPYMDQKNMEDYAVPAKEDEQVTQTFCGT